MTGPDVRISLQPVASYVHASDGRDVPFARAALTISNAGGTEVTGLVVHATLGQEGGTVQDVSHVFGGTAAPIASGGSETWDVFDLLLPAHQGTASKVHMFGYRAILNWRFELSVWADYVPSGSAGPVTTPVSRWTLRWSVPDASTGAVVLAIEEGRG